MIKNCSITFWRQTHRPAVRRIRKNWFFFLSLVFVFVYGASARADVQSYAEGDNVTHLSPFYLDDRYKLFFKGAETFDFENLKSAPILTDIQRSTRFPASSEFLNAFANAPKILTFFDISPDYKAVKYLLREASVTNGIDYELLQALIATESGFNSFAVSPRGAVGLMQLIPPTAERYGVKGDKDSPVSKKLTDPRTNILAGSRYLKDLISFFPGRLELAIAAYNAGEGAVQRAGNQIPNFPETKNYVRTVLKLYAELKPSNSMATE